MFEATAKRWDGGWEIHVEGVGVTQTRTLGTAAQQAADLISTYRDIEVGPDEVTVVPVLGDRLQTQITKARAMVRDAEHRQQEAAVASRLAARTLRDEGLSVSDSAAVLGVSRGRVSQLVTDKR